MAIDKQKFVDDMVEIHKKRKQLQQLSNQRRQEEENLVVEFRINEANAKRAEIQSRYNSLMSTIQAEINSLSENLGEVV
jgi:septation ring formation regulator EzrA